MWFLKFREELDLDEGENEAGRLLQPGYQKSWCDV